MYKDLVLKNRSYRRFYEHEKIDLSTLTELIDLARCSPSAQNKQPLKYIISNSEENNNLIFPTLSWAGYLKDWDGPSEGEKPSAYIIILVDKKVSPTFSCDHGIAAQTILLGATEKGFGGCMMGAIQRDKLQAAIEIEEHYEILLVIALGKPKETIVLEEINNEGDIRYYRDSDDVHHVPKRKLKDIIVKSI